MKEPRTKEDARKHRYRTWAGNPKGEPYIESRCVCDVSDGGRSVLSHQCYRKPGHGPDNLYCKQHAAKVEEE